MSIATAWSRVPQSLPSFAEAPSEAEEEVEGFASGLSDANLGLCRARISPSGVATECRKVGLAGLLETAQTTGQGENPTPTPIGVQAAQVSAQKAGRQPGARGQVPSPSPAINTRKRPSTATLATL